MSRSVIRHKNPRGKLTHPSQGQELESAGRFTDQTKNSISSKKCEKVLYVTVIYTTHGNYNRDPFNYQHFNLAEFSLKVGSEQIPLPELKCNMDNDSNDILRPLFSALLANHSLFSNEELGINPSNYRNGNVFLAWDLSQMAPGQSFEMTKEKPVSLILKLRRANDFVINVIVYSE